MLCAHDHAWVSDMYLSGLSMEAVADRTGFSYRTVHRSLTRVTRTSLPAIRCRFCRSEFTPRRQDARYCCVQHQRSAASIQFRYGLTPEDLNGLLESQNHECALCGKPIAVGGFEVDHSHDTGNVRGLLCSRCNRGLGTFGDDESLLHQAIKYLEERK